MSNIKINSFAGSAGSLACSLAEQAKSSQTKIVRVISAFPFAGANVQARLPALPSKKLPF